MAQYNNIIKENAVTGNVYNSPKAFFFQPKLSINQPDDPNNYRDEQEADEMADKFMRMTEPGEKNFFSPPVVQRKCAHCEEEERKLQRKEINSSENIADTSTENYISSLNGKGKSLSSQERNFFEPRMSYDFSNVQLHTNNEANQSAKDINALAYTHENNIVFGSGQYQPNTDEGKRLMAHELTHVVQQSGKAQRNIKNEVRRKGSDDKTDDFQLADWFKDATAKSHFTNQVAAIFFPSGKYVPDADDNRLVDLIVKNYAYTVQRHNGIKIKLVGHADSRDFLKMTNDELSFQRARWISGTLKSSFRDAGIPESLIITEITKEGDADCKTDPACYKTHDPAAMAMERRVDIIIDDTQIPIPDNVDCPPGNIIKIETLSEYIDLVRCAEKITGYDSRKMLSLLRQLYYGSNSWSANPNVFWDAVIPCKESFSKSPMEEFDKNIFLSLQQNNVIEGKDIGHVFTGLEAMACPQDVTISKSKFGIGITLPTSISNELFATWLGDIGSSLGQYVACFMMQGQVSDDIMKTDCDITAKTVDEAVKKINPHYYFEKLSSSADLEGDIDAFVIRADQNNIPCKNSEKQTLNMQFPVSGMLRMYYFNTSPAKNNVNRFSCFADVLGAQISSNKIINKAEINKKYHEQVSNFAQLFYAKNVKISGSRIPKDVSLEQIERNTNNILNMFWSWIERKM